MAANFKCVKRKYKKGALDLFYIYKKYRNKINVWGYMKMDFVYI